MRSKEGGAPLRRRRKRDRLSQRELGLLVKCSHTMIGLLERDETTVGEDLANRIAYRLDCDVEDLFSEHSLPRMTEVPTVSLDSSRTAHPATSLAASRKPA